MQVRADVAASLALLAAFATNTVSKSAVALVMGRWRCALAVWPGLLLVLAGAWGGWAAQTVL